MSRSRSHKRRGERRRYVISVGSNTYSKLKRRYKASRRSTSKRTRSKSKSAMSNSRRTRSNSSRRGSATRGWAKAAPRGSRTRREMRKRCGSKCFLDSANLKYPVCKEGSCEIDKRGVQSAYIRARQYKNEKVARAAKKLLEKL